MFDILTALLLSLQPVAAAKDERCVPGAIPAEEGMITTADGAKLYYRKLGRGRPAAIYLHGGPGGTIYNGGCEIAPLARHYTLILYDQRGGGRSDLVSQTDRLEYQDHVSDLDAVRRHFKIRRVALIGLSWGSALATLYAETHPDNVSRLMLLAPMPIAKNPFDEERWAAVTEAAGPELMAKRRQLSQQLQAATSPGEVIALCRRLLVEAALPYLLDPARHRSQTGCDFPASVISNRAVVSRHTLRSLGDWDFRPALARIRVPVLIVEGARTVVPLSSPTLWAKTAPNGKLLLVPDAGHEVGMDQPELLVSIARTFLSGGWPDSASREFRIVVRRPKARS